MGVRSQGVEGAVVRITLVLGIGVSSNNDLIVSVSNLDKSCVLNIGAEAMQDPSQTRSMQPATASRYRPR